MRRTRLRFGLVGLVQIHHIIPREHAAHPAVHATFNMDGASNLMFMPTVLGTQCLQLRPGRLVHDGGHPRYNAFVYKRLDDLIVQRGDIHQIAASLRRRLRESDSDLPWR